MKSLVLELWSRNRDLRRQLRAAQRQLAEIARLKHLLATVEQRINEANSRAAAEHYRAFKLGHDYKVQELDLNATRTERDLAYERARKLAARVLELENGSHRPR
jgi:hypothetical protein